MVIPGEVRPRTPGEAADHQSLCRLPLLRDNCWLIKDPGTAAEAHFVSRAFVRQLGNPFLGDAGRWPPDGGRDDQDADYDQATANEPSIAARRPRLVGDPNRDGKQQ